MLTWRIWYRNIHRQKLVFLLNLTGLALGISSAYLICRWSIDELTYDRFHLDYQAIWLVQIADKNLTVSTATPSPLGPALQEEYPEIIAQTRYTYYTGGELLEHESRRMYARGIEVDPDFFAIFHFPLIAGDLRTFTSQPNSIFLTRALAGRLFGEENPLGKTLRFRNQRLLKVNGILADIPPNSSLQFEYVIPHPSLQESDGEWGAWSPATFVKLDHNADPDAVARKLRRFTKIYERNERELVLFPLRDIHFNLEDRVFFQGFTRWIYVQAMIIMAVFILSVSCINYVNLTTALFSRRAREIGVRKILGAGKGELRGQFMQEALIQGALAIALGFIMLLLAGKFIDSFAWNELSYLLNFNSMLIFCGIGFLVILLSGIYPAFVLAAFPPLSLVRNHSRPGSKRSVFRGMLIVCQFAVTITVLTGTGILNRQIHYIRQKDLGYTKENLVVIPLARGNSGEKQDRIRNDLAAVPAVENVSAGSFRHVYFDEKVSEWEGKSHEGFIRIFGLAADTEFSRTMHFTLLAGRFFSKGFTDELSIVINETAARQMGMSHPVGKKVTWRNAERTIIGLVKDFNYRGLSQEIEPVFLFEAPQGDLYVRIRPENTAQTLGTLKSIINRHIPEFPFEYHFMEAEVAAMYTSERTLEQILAFFASTCLLLSGLGLYALSAHINRERSKEVALRKIFGAPLYRIAGELTSRFLKWVLIAGALAIPLATWGMNEWLSNYAYRIRISFADILVPLGISLLIALAAIAGNIRKAASQNPLDTVRIE